MAETAVIAEPIGGDKLYQRRAREAFPLLVRQAEARAKILYSDLAEELGMPNPRNLNYPLGSIGRTLERLSAHWEEEIPPIQCVVVNKGGLPGEGIGHFLDKRDDFASLSKSRQREIVNYHLGRIFDYPRWRQVLDALSLPHPQGQLALVIAKAARFGGGESDDHKRLKQFVARNPSVIGLPESAPEGKSEYPIASGDSLDVSFREDGDWVAAEVKSSRSPVEDIARGLFQCVKYRAVMEALQVVAGHPKTAQAVLVLESRLPESLKSLRNTLGITVHDNVVPR